MSSILASTTSSQHLPIHVLNPNITHELESAAHRSRLTEERAIASGLIDAKLVFCFGPERPAPPFVVLESKMVHLQESYLAYLWAMIYSSFVIYEHGVQEPMMKGTFDGTCKYNSQELMRGKQLGDWAKRFAFQYEAWDDQLLPNPERHLDVIEKTLAGKANAMFLRAVTYLIAHEFGHLAGRHDVETSNVERIEQEKEADNFALAFLVDGEASETEKQISGAALVMLTCSNLFLTVEFPQVWKRRHPHTHDRIRNAISGLNLTAQKGKDYLYYLAAIGLKQFLDSKQLASGAPFEDTAEDLFHWYLDRYDELLALS
jgi:hypothetical protein